MITIDIYTTVVYNSKSKGDDMKRTELIRLLKQNGWWLKSTRGPHDKYTNGTDCEAIERHTEIPDELAKAIIKRRGLK
jgi:predicted RNA binding protein YcfA (HicA-like mRNA interferase family)